MLARYHCLSPTIGIMITKITILISVLSIYSFCRLSICYGNQYSFSKKNHLLDYSQKHYQNMQSLESFAVSLHQLNQIYVEKSQSNINTLIEAAIEGMVSTLDSNTIYLNQKRFMELYEFAQGRYGGIGIIINKINSQYIILTTMDKSPAHKAGIKNGDQIISIEDEKLTTDNASSKLDIIKGVPGSKIKLSVKRNNQILDFSITREIIAQISVFTKMLSNQIGYIKITNFQEDTSKTVHKFITEKNNQLLGLIIDLRNNPGGLLDQAVDIVDMFVDTGVIVSTIGRNKKNIEREYAYKAGTLGSFPIIVMVNDKSASSAEIVAGALQDHNRALILGQKTYGKGSVQTLVALPYGGGLKITIARYFTPSGNSIEAKGITPDISLKFIKQDNQDPKVEISNNHVKKSNSILLKHQNQDLNDNLKGLNQSISSWTEHNKKDQELKVAYIYLRKMLKLDQN